MFSLAAIFSLFHKLVVFVFTHLIFVIISRLNIVFVKLQNQHKVDSCYRKKKTLCFVSVFLAKTVGLIGTTETTNVGIIGWKWVKTHNHSTSINF